jgi:hypothetical protein
LSSLEEAVVVIDQRRKEATAGTDASVRAAGAYLKGLHEALERLVRTGKEDAAKQRSALVQAAGWRSELMGANPARDRAQGLLLAVTAAASADTDALKAMMAADTTACSALLSNHTPLLTTAMFAPFALARRSGAVAARPPCSTLLVGLAFYNDIDARVAALRELGGVPQALLDARTSAQLFALGFRGIEVEDGGFAVRSCGVTAWFQTALDAAVAWDVVWTWHHPTGLTQNGSQVKLCFLDLETPSPSMCTTAGWGPIQPFPPAAVSAAAAAHFPLPAVRVPAGCGEGDGAAAGGRADAMDADDDGAGAHAARARGAPAGGAGAATADVAARFSLLKRDAMVVHILKAGPAGAEKERLRVYRLNRDQLCALHTHLVAVAAAPVVEADGDDADDEDPADGFVRKSKGRNRKRAHGAAAEFKPAVIAPRSGKDLEAFAAALYSDVAYNALVAARVTALQKRRRADGDGEGKTDSEMEKDEVLPATAHAEEHGEDEEEGDEDEQAGAENAKAVVATAPRGQASDSDSDVVLDLSDYDDDGKVKNRRAPPPPPPPIRCTAGMLSEVLKRIKLGGAMAAGAHRVTALTPAAAGGAGAQGAAAVAGGDAPGGAVVAHGLAIRNGGNQCYVIAALRVLVAADPNLKVPVLGPGEKAPAPAPGVAVPQLKPTPAELDVAAAFKAACAALTPGSSPELNNQGAVVPVASALAALKKEISGEVRFELGAQDDAQEAVGELLDCLEMAGLGAQLWARVEEGRQCPCGHEYSGEGAPTLGMQLPAGGSFEERMCKLFIQRDHGDAQLDGGAECPACKQHRKGQTRTTTLLAGPDVLCVDLKVPSGDPTQGAGLEIPETLSLHGHMSPALQSKVAPQDAVWQLRGVIMHRGPHPRSGHYISRVRTSDGKWWEVNDAVVVALARPNEPRALLHVGELPFRPTMAVFKRVTPVPAATAR